MFSWVAVGQVEPYFFLLKKIQFNLLSVLLSNGFGSSLIPGGSSLVWSEFFIPQRAGVTRLIATLDCRAIRQVHGQATFTIKP